MTATPFATSVRADRIVFQGESGANSDIACRELFPDITPRAMPTFEDCFQALATGEADLGVIPFENSVAGRVADIHHLLPTADLSIIGEHFLPIHHQLLGLPGARTADLKVVQSHVHALGQCRNIVRRLGVSAEVAADTAGSARQIREIGDPARGAFASRLAAKIHNLDILEEN
ncbi:MAG: prephenate dehydratase domain-containing protein, partial [Alphaproteobacteria bacterium]